MWLGVGPDVSPALTLLPSVLAIAAIAAVSVIPFVVARRGWTNRAAVALAEGVREAGRVLRRRDWRVIAGSVGYWAFDNAVLWACLHAFGESPPVTLVLMGYLIGQLGGLLPIPGGLGGIDGGLLGALVVYGLPAATAAAGDPRLPRDPLLAATDPRRRRIRLSAQGPAGSRAPGSLRPVPAPSGRAVSDVLAPTVSDELEDWLGGDQPKTLGNFIELFGPRSSLEDRERHALRQIVVDGLLLGPARGGDARAGRRDLPGISIVNGRIVVSSADRAVMTAMWSLLGGDGGLVTPSLSADRRPVTHVEAPWVWSLGFRLTPDHPAEDH